ncbi:MAG TPA: TonB-dependent siderophore receptor [Marinagarivorans sp.]
MSTNRCTQRLTTRNKHHGVKIATALALGLGYASQTYAQGTEATQSSANNAQIIEEVMVEGEHTEQKLSSRLPFAVRELPQSVSEISRDFMDNMAITNINDVMMNVTGVNVTLYDSQRPLYFARGFQITDFQVDGIPTYSNLTNQEYDTALYQSIEVIRGANGLISGTGDPSATVNMIRKRPGKAWDTELAASVGSWNTRRVEADITAPLTKDGSVRSRVVVAYQDGDSYRDRYSEDKTAVLGVLEADLTTDTTVALGYQNQDNNPVGTIWGTVPIFAADGSEAKFPVSTSFAPEWTQWQRESSTLFVDLSHRFNDVWNLRASVNRTEGDVNSLRVYALGYPDRETGGGMNLLSSMQAVEDTRDSLDIFLTGGYSAFGREHELIFGANISEHSSEAQDYSIDEPWQYEVPNAWDYNGEAPRPNYQRTGSYDITTTQQRGIYAANRFRITDALSFIGGARLSSWETKKDNFDVTGNYDDTTGDFDVSGEVTPYAGLTYDLSETLTVYTSYTDVFSPQGNKDKNGNVLEPVVGSNLELGLKGSFYNQQLMTAVALFNTKKDNFAVQDPSVPSNFVQPDGTPGASIAVDGTESQGVELDINGQLNDQWTINAGYTYVDTKRKETDRIWTNLPEHTLQLSSHYQLSGALEKLQLGGGVNWQSKTVGYGVSHPSENDATYTQDPYSLVNFYATWQFNEQFKATFSGTNLLDETYWANIDYANYGEPRNVSLRLAWQL